MTARFLQIHTLTGYAATLLNRDDVGRAKRLPFGGSDRIRVSSQCLKRHWRQETGTWSLKDLGSKKSVRSRRVFSKVIAERLQSLGLEIPHIINVLTPIRAAVLGESIKTKQARNAKNAPAAEGTTNLFPDADTQRDDSDLRTALDTKQVIVLGEPEIDFLTSLAQDLATDDPEKTARNVVKYFKDRKTKANLKALATGAGLDAAIFGRMATSDLMARCDAAVHVAHSFTVHAEETESDYFSAVDDWLSAEGELGSGHINTSELTSGLFYGYVVIDLNHLVSNLSNDRELAAETLRRLVHLIATVSPGAKRGATAPYACAELVLLETGDTQPRTLANAFMKAVRPPDTKSGAVTAMDAYLKRYDAMYGTREDRRLATMIDEPPLQNGGEHLTLDEIAAWAAAHVEEAA